ncbi:tetratricopeptide repeat protein [Catenulispora rubra]|uniref:tetratricopeptide repeat protein n=1 Tax=Catenulispora rubra TaxID=280293 RepID=UPI00189235A7|nr:tetratricopeptide repeat protein [Catenulispora rubra]
MTEYSFPDLPTLRELVKEDPVRHGGEAALLLADAGLELLESGRWRESLSLLDEASHFTELTHPQAPPLPWGRRLAAARGMPVKRGYREVALGIFRDAAHALPAGHALWPIATSRLATRLVDIYRTTGDRLVLNEAITVCSDAIGTVGSTAASDATAQLRANLADALRARFDLTQDAADLDRATSLWEAALDQTPASHPDHPVFLSNLANDLLAQFDVTNDLTDLNRAIANFRQAVEETSPDEAHRPTLESNLGAALMRRFHCANGMADLDEAVASLRDAAAVEGPSQALARSNLGAALQTRSTITGADADHAEALTHLRAAAAILPADSPEYPATLSALADGLFDAGQLSEARELFAEAERRRESTLGPDHPDTLASRHNLASTMAALGHFSVAEGEFRSILAARHRVLGDRHPDTLTTLHNLATVLSDLGRDDEAELLFEQLIQARTAVLGPDHPATRASRTAFEEIAHQ